MVKERRQRGGRQQGGQKEGKRGRNEKREGRERVLAYMHIIYSSSYKSHAGKLNIGEYMMESV